MGVVYRARHLVLNRVVALKTILAGGHADERDRARFRAEAQAVARLQHPNIVQIFEVGEHHGHAFFCLEFVAGGSLADQLRDGRPRPVVDSARLVETLARAMHFAHERGVIHRDLKPANVLLSTAGGFAFGASGPANANLPAGVVPKITDFGLAKTLDGDAGHTRTGLAVGTPGYMAPEQATAQKQVGPAVDVYALGVLLYQLVTARLPFAGETPMEVMIKTTTEEPPRPSRFVPRLPRDLETIILKCLEKAPARRYASAADLADDLGRFLAHEPILARSTPHWERVVRRVRRQPVVAGLLLVAVVTLSGLLLSLAVQVHGERRRAAVARDTVEQAVVQARAAAAQGAWKEVRAIFAAGVDLRAVREPSLAAEARTLAARAEGELAVRATFRAFELARDDALFHATLAADAAQVRQTRDRALAALRLAGAGPASGPRPGPFHTEREKEALRDGCYELLLVLAELAAQRLPGQDEPGGRAALALLDVAAGMGIETHAFHLRKARYLEQAGLAERARSERERARARPATTSLDHYLVGTEHYRQGNVAAAERAFLTALGVRPEHFWARYFLALCQAQQDQYVAARDNLTACLSQRALVWIYLVRGFVQGQLGQYVEAEADFHHALNQLGSRAGPAAQYALYNNRAVTSLGLGKHAAAEQDLHRATALEPEQYQAHATLAHVYLAQKRHGEARAALDRAIAAARLQHARRELDAGTLVLLYRTSCELNRTAPRPNVSAALDDLRAVIALEGVAADVKARAQYDRGTLLLGQAKAREALTAFESALAELPDHLDAQRWRAEALLHLERWDEALAGFERYLASGGKPLAVVYRGRATARVRCGRSSEAVADFTLALALAPGDKSLWLQRGRAYLARQAWGLAVDDFDQVLKRDARCAEAYHGRGLARLHLGQVDDAATDAKRTARHAPDDPHLLLAAAVLLTQAADRSSRRESATRRDHAVALLFSALEHTPLAQRRDFWGRHVQKSSSLRLLGGNDDFRRLEMRFGPIR
jgi:tetratricopeptide (TPR) repeat protein